MYLQVNAFVGSKEPAKTGGTLQAAILDGSLDTALQAIGLGLDQSKYAITVRPAPLYCALYRPHAASLKAGFFFLEVLWREL